LSAVDARKVRETNGGLITSAILLSVSVNVMATALIWSRLSRARRQTTEALDAGNKTSTLCSNTAAILIESAVPLTIFGVMKAVTTVILHSASISLITAAHWGIVDDVFACLYYSFA
jgi:hypothetical protein